MRFLTMSKIRRAGKQIKYIIQAIAMFNRDVMPIIRMYLSNCKLMLNDIRNLELLEENKDASDIKKK